MAKTQLPRREFLKLACRIRSYCSSPTPTFSKDSYFPPVRPKKLKPLAAEQSQPSKEQQSAQSEENKSLRLPRRMIVGLGNPGSEYEFSRHNVGFEVCKTFATLANTWWTPADGDPKFELIVNRSSKSLMCSGPMDFTLRTGDDLVDQTSERRRARTLAEGVPFPKLDVMVVLPQTYMNLSGGAVKNIVQNQKWRLKRNADSSGKGDEVLVVMDDVTLPFGQLRLRPKGGDGGHNGLKDICKRLNSGNIPRLKIGVGPRSDLHGSPLPPVGTKALASYVLSNFTQEEKQYLPHVCKFAAEVIRVYLHRGFNAASSVTNGNKDCLAMVVRSSKD